MVRLDDLTISRLRQAYINGPEKTKQSLCDRLATEFGVSIPSIRRYAEKGNWEALRQANLTTQTAVARTAKASALTSTLETAIAGQVFDTDELLITAINAMAKDLTQTTSKSREAVAGTLGRLIETYRRQHPVTVHELVDLALAIPDFSAEEFARLLRERLSLRSQTS